MASHGHEDNHPGGSEEDNAASLQNSTLLSQSFVPQTGNPHDEHLALCVIHIFLALWVCLTNSSQIINILLSQGLRTQTKNALVANVSVTELIMGAFLCPLYSDSLMQGMWRHDLNTCMVYEVIFYAQVCISVLAVLVLVVERFYFLLTPMMTDGAGRRTLTAILVLLPWAVGLSMVIPLFLNGASASFNEDSKSCQILWKKKYQTVTVFASFFCPAFLLLSMAAAVVMLYVIFSVIAKRRDLGPNPDRPLMKDSLRVVLLSTFICVLFQFPFFIVLLMEMFCLSDDNSSAPCGQSEVTWAVVMAIIMLKPGLMPLAWLAYKDIRNGFLFGLGLHRMRRRRRDTDQRDMDLSLADVGRSDRALTSTTM